MLNDGKVKAYASITVGNTSDLQARGSADILKISIELHGIAILLFEAIWLIYMLPTGRSSASARIAGTVKCGSIAKYLDKPS